mgnify:CR=1 FL=1
MTASNKIMEQLVLSSKDLQKPARENKNLFEDKKSPPSIYHIESSELSIGKDSWDAVFGGEEDLEES